MSNYETMKDRMSSHFLEYDQKKWFGNLIWSMMKSISIFSL